VTGETICRKLSPVEATHSPPTKFSRVRTVTAMPVFSTPAVSSAP
jgi:hypothetical protein